MTNFGSKAEKLASVISDKESDLQLLTKFNIEGGKHRLAIVADHPDAAISKTLTRLFNKPSIAPALLRAMVGIAEAELHLAKEELLSFVTAPLPSEGGKA